MVYKLQHKCLGNSGARWPKERTNLRDNKVLYFVVDWFQEMCGKTLATVGNLTDELILDLVQILGNILYISN